MNFATYAAFRTASQQLIDGDDVSQSDLSVPILDLIIGAGEQRLYRELRSSTQDTAFSLTTTGNLVTLPSDFLELRGAPYIANKVVATYAPWEAVQNQIQLQGSSVTSSNPVRYTFQSDKLLFFPAQADGTSVTGQYYKRFADISGALNVLFTRHPDVFLYAALSESAPYVGETSRLTIWEGKYKELIAAANEQERRRVTRGSKLQARVA